MAKAPADIRSLARSHTARAIQVLAGIMDNPGSAESARISAAAILIDRGHGKAVMHIESLRRTVSTLSDNELADIAAGCSEGADPAPIDESLH